MITEQIASKEQVLKTKELMKNLFYLIKESKGKKLAWPLPYKDDKR